MMQKFIHSDIPSIDSDDGFNKDTQNTGDISTCQLKREQVTPEELDAWLRSTDVVLELTAPDESAVKDWSKHRVDNSHLKTRTEKSLSRSRHSRRGNFMNRRRSSLDDPENRPIFGMEARALLEDTFVPNNAVGDEKEGKKKEKKDCTSKDERNRSSFGTPVVCDLLIRRQLVRNIELSNTRHPSDSPSHGSSFDVTALSSVHSPSNHNSIKKHNQDPDDSLKDIQPTKKRRVSFPADSDFNENGHVIVDSNNIAADQMPENIINRHGQFRRCQSDPEEYPSSTFHNSNNNITFHHFSRHVSFDSSSRSKSISQSSPSKFITTLDHSQETSDFIFKFESRRKPNHIVPLANMHSRLEANAKSRTSRKLLMNVFKGSCIFDGATHFSNGHYTASGEKECFGNNYSIGRRDSVMMMDNCHHHSRRSTPYYRHCHGEYSSRRVSNESFREHHNHYRSSSCCQGETTRFASNDRYICRENF